MGALAIVESGASGGDIEHLWRYESLGRNPARVYLASLASGSVPTMLRSLEVIAGLIKPGCDIDSIPWHMLRYEHTQAIRARLAADYDYRTANKMLSALRQVLKHAWRLDYMTADEYMKAADIANVKGSKPDQAAGRSVSFGELSALIDACNDGSIAGVRDTAMLAVAYAGGLRRAEIVHIVLADVDLTNGVILVKGKRNKIRTVPLQEGALQAVTDWLSVRGDEEGHLFTRIDKGAKLTRDGLTTQAVYYIFAERAQQAKVKPFSPHDMRRTFAGDLLDAGVDISTVQKLMGHSNVNTTAGYDRRGERAKKDATKKIHFPYRGHK